MIEAWGRGFIKIKEACAQYEAPLPEYDINEEGIMVLCKACDKYMRILQNDAHPVQNVKDDVQDDTGLLQNTKVRTGDCLRIWFF